jgi:hypothetical protein
MLTIGLVVGPGGSMPRAYRLRAVGAMMREMRAVLLAFIVACGSPQSPPPPPIANTAPPPPPVDAKPLTVTEQALIKMAQLRDAMCKCSDTDCLQQVSQDMTTWAQEMAKHNPEPPKMTDEETKRATEIGQQMGECMQRIMGQPQPQGPKTP